MYAIIRTGGKQYRVREGDRIAIERLDAAEGTEVVFDQVLAVERGEALELGEPTVAGAAVRAEVQEHFRARKLLGMKYKNKTRQRTLRGHRQQHTRVRITAIEAGAP